MRWVLLALLAAGGIFYLASRFMPRSDTVDIQWVQSQVKPGMSEQEVIDTLATQPSQRVRDAVGNSQVMYFTDRFDEKDSLVIHFVEGHVYKVEIEDR